MKKSLKPPAICLVRSTTGDTDEAPHQSDQRGQGVGTTTHRNAHVKRDAKEEGAEQLNGASEARAPLVHWGRGFQRRADHGGAL